MKIAVCGRKDEVIRRTEKLRQYFNASDIDVKLDMYTNQDELVANMFQYDTVCLSDLSVDCIVRTFVNQVVFEWGKKIRTCNVSDIYYVEADLKNVHICFKREETIVHLPFFKVEQILAAYDFIKIHRSYLVNCSYIHNMDDNSVMLKDGRVLPLSKYRSEEVRKQFAEYVRKNGRG